MIRRTRPFDRPGPQLARRRGPRSLLLPLLLPILLVAAGCAAASPTPAPTGTPSGENPAASPSASSAPSGAAATTGPASEAPPGATPGENPIAAMLAGHPWAAASLTDVTTGETFTIASLAGRTVFVEAMAIWCSKCRAQQTQFRDALGQLDPDRVEYVVLTVDPSETADALARYKSERGFVGRYAVAGTDVATALRNEFGATVLNPPSVPLIHIARDGTITFSTGGESVEEILRLAGA